MTKQNFLDRMAALYANNVELCRRKNADYSPAADPFSNFKVCEALGIPTEVGLIVRMTDKISRAASLVQPGKQAQVLDESILDTLSDLANYAMILRIYLEQK